MDTLFKHCLRPAFKIFPRVGTCLLKGKNCTLRVKIHPQYKKKIIFYFIKNNLKSDVSHLKRGDLLFLVKIEYTIDLLLS